MKTLIIHHLESCWEKAYRKYGTSLEQFAMDIVGHIFFSSYDRIILTRFEGTEFEDCHFNYGIAEHIDEIQEYGYGWEEEMFEGSNLKKGIDYVDGGSHSQVVLVPDWIRNLDGEVFLCGAFDGECIEDMEIALRAAGIEFKRLNSLIVG